MLRCPAPKTTSSLTLIPDASADQAGDVWQVRRILVPGWVENGDVRSRPVGAVSVSRRHDLVGAAEDQAERPREDLTWLQDFYAEEPSADARDLTALAHHLAAANRGSRRRPKPTRRKR